MGEHVDTRQLREQKAKRPKSKNKNEIFDDTPRKKPKTFKQFINPKNGTYDPEDGIDEDEQYRGIKIK